MLFRHDRHPDHDPVAHQREEVLEDCEEVVTPRDRAHKVDGHDEAHPDVARDCLAAPAENLATQCGGVRARHIVRDDAEGDDDAAEFAEPAEAAVAGEDERAGRGLVGGLPGGIAGDARSEADADHVDETEGEREADEGHEEGDSLRGVGRVIDEEVGACAGPGDGDGQRKREEGKSAGRDGGPVAGRGSGRVVVAGRDTNQDEEDNGLGEPCPSDVRCQSVCDRSSSHCNERTVRRRERAPCQRRQPAN